MKTLVFLDDLTVSLRIVVSCTLATGTLIPLALPEDTYSGRTMVSMAGLPSVDGRLLSSMAGQTISSNGGMIV